MKEPSVSFSCCCSCSENDADADGGDEDRSMMSFQLPKKALLKASFSSFGFWPVSANVVVVVVAVVVFFFFGAW